MAETTTASAATMAVTTMTIDNDNNEKVSNPDRVVDSKEATPIIINNNNTQTEKDTTTHVQLVIDKVGKDHRINNDDDNDGDHQESSVTIPSCVQKAAVGTHVHNDGDNNNPTTTEHNRDTTLVRKSNFVPPILDWKDAPADGKVYFYPAGGAGNKKRKKQLFFRNLIKHYAVEYHDTEMDKREFVTEKIMIHFPNGAYTEVLNKNNDGKNDHTTSTGSNSGHHCPKRKQQQPSFVKADEDEIFKTISQKLRDVYNKEIKIKEDTKSSVVKKSSKKSSKKSPTSKSMARSVEEGSDLEELDHDDDDENADMLKHQFWTYITSVRAENAKLRSINAKQKEKIRTLELLLADKEEREKRATTTTRVRPRKKARNNESSAPPNDSTTTEQHLGDQMEEV